MSPLWSILTACLAGGVLSLVAAAAFAFSAPTRWLPLLVSYAVGALLAAAFLEVLPNAIESASSSAAAMAYVLGGIMLFFVLEKLVLWRHCHDEGCEGHDHGASSEPGHAHEHGRSGLMIVIGDTFHNFVDGVLIAAAFSQDAALGTVTALAIIAHEIPQEVGDFVILRHSGYSRTQAFAANAVSSLATLVGAILAYYLFDRTQSLVPLFLGVAAASMIYVAVADLIPGLHRRTSLSDSLKQVSGIAVGMGSIILVDLLVAHPLG